MVNLYELAITLVAQYLKPRLADFASKAIFETLSV